MCLFRDVELPEDFPLWPKLPYYAFTDYFLCAIGLSIGPIAGKPRYAAFILI